MFFDVFKICIDNLEQSLYQGCSWQTEAIVSLIPLSVQFFSLVFFFLFVVIINTLNT